MGDYWSEEEVDRLEELRCEGLSFDEMAPYLGRSGRAVKAKYATLREHSEFDWEAKAKIGSAKLLSALKKHHDPDEACEEDAEIPAPELPEPEPEPEIQPAIMTKLQPTIKNIKVAVAKHFNIHQCDLASHRRTHDIIYPRHIAYYICRVLTPHSYPEIGRRLGGKDHTSVLSGCRKIEALTKIDPKVVEDIAAIKSAFDCENEAGGAS
jgi:hypothetical protein